MSLLTVYHGSKKIISVPSIELSEPYKDFGRGFYVTENRQAAAQWACSPASGGFVNKFEIETENLNILDLYSADYNILNWLALVMSRRLFRVPDSSFEKGFEYVKENFSIKTNGFDLIKGPRADEACFLFIKGFFRGEISLLRLKSLMYSDPIGPQFVIKSPEAFRRLSFISFEGVDAAYEYPHKKVRNDAALTEYYLKCRQGEENGIYISDIYKEEMKNDDERLR